MNYQQLIESTIVPGSLSEEEKSKLYNPIINTINQLLPRKLYRYRCCKERHLSAFFYDELWFSTGSVMNDDFDARLYYNKKKIYSWLNSSISEDGCLDVFKNLARIEKLPSKLLEVIPNAEFNFNSLKNITREQTISLSMSLINFIKSDLNNSLKEITNRVQGLTKFACFSENIFSGAMWGLYSENSTGFAIEYDFGNESIIKYGNSVDNKSTVSCNIFPIIYGNRRMDTTEYALYLYQEQLLNRMASLNGIYWNKQWIDSFVPCPDEFTVTKLAIKKSSEWKNEKEWRMFFLTNDMYLANQQFSFVKYKPTAVYLGRNISSFNQDVLIEIARKKRIPVFKMYIDDSIRNYRLKCHKL